MAQGVETLDAAYRDWMAKNNVGSGVLAVSYERRLVVAQGYGGTHPNAAVLLASLSKAITAVCAATLVDAGRIGFETRLADIPDYFRRYGEPSDPRVASITVAQLLTHRSGYDRAGDPTIKALADLLSTQTPRQPMIDQFLARALRAKLAKQPGEGYAYSNMAYLMLGAAIEAASGLTGAALDPDWRVLSAYGGWKLSGPQYLKFLEAFAADSKILGLKGQAFMADGTDKWMNERREVYYTLGMQARAATGGRNVWHSGELRFSFRNAVNLMNANFGTFAVRQARGISWFAQYVPHPGDAAVGDLDRTMSRALAAIKTWPSGDLYSGEAK